MGTKMHDKQRQQASLLLLILNSWIWAVATIVLALITHFRRQYGLTEEVSVELLIMVPAVHFLLIGINLVFYRKRNVTGVWMITMLAAFLLHSAAVFLCLGTDVDLVWNNWNIFPYTTKTVLAYMEIMTVCLPFAFMWPFHGYYFFDEFCCRVKALQGIKQAPKADDGFNEFIKDHAHHAEKIVDLEHLVKLRRLRTMAQKIK